MNFIVLYITATRIPDLVVSAGISVISAIAGAAGTAGTAGVPDIPTQPCTSSNL